MILALILAVSISTSELGTFMTPPSWMPTSVPSDYTFGSTGRTAEKRMSNRTLAAAEALFDAYYERVYFQSASGVSDKNWNIQQYGSRNFKEMRFSPAFNYRSGNRIVPVSKRIIEFGQIDDMSQSISDLVDSTGGLIYRDIWRNSSYGYCSMWSSSFMGYSRLPSAYGWKTSANNNSYFQSCKPVLAYIADEYVHVDGSRRMYYFAYPLCAMFQIADTSYFADLALHDLEVDEKFTDLVDDSFYAYDTESGVGLPSRRFIKDDSIDGTNRYSSQIASVSRVLASLDRSYMFPKVSEYVTTSNTSISATGEVWQEYDGFANNIVLSFYIGQRNGSFACPEIHDPPISEFGPTERVMVCTTNRAESFDARRDRGRFGGVGTSAITAIGMTIDDPVVITTIGSLCGEAIYYSLDQMTNEVEISYMGAENENQVMISIRPKTESSACYQRSTIIGYQDANFSIRCGARRVSSCAYTDPINADIVNDLIDEKCLVPCGSAYDTGRVLSADASVLCFGCEYIHSEGYEAIGINSDATYYSSLPSSVEEQKIHHSMINSNLPTKRSLTNSAYINARIETRNKVFSELSKVKPTWNNPPLNCNVLMSYIEGSTSGSNVSISGGSLDLLTKINGVDSTELRIFMETEYLPWPIDEMRIKRIGRLVNDEIMWYGDSVTIDMYVVLKPFNGSPGYQIRTDIKELDAPAVSMDALAVPMVTTDWNWKALKIESDESP